MFLYMSLHRRHQFVFNLEPSTGRKELQLKLNWPVQGKLYKVCKRKNFHAARILTMLVTFALLF